MGYATTVLGCGCITTMIMESGKIVQYERCAEHYVVEDDVKIVEAMRNKKEQEKKFWDDATKFFHGGK